MKKHHTPGTKMPERTTFQLTQDEVAQAIVNYVMKQGETVPDGKCHVRGREEQDYASGDSWINLTWATLTIDHK